jgi:hypothetical protein
MFWLNRYIFRGSKLLFALGMLTILALAIISHMRRAPEHPPTHATWHGRPSQ